MIDWTTHTYLQQGTPRQQRAYDCLTKLAMFDTLAPYSPVLAGTIPLDVDTPESDLDIIGEVDNPTQFTDIVTRTYGNQRNFRIRHTHIGTLPTIIANFDHDFAIEIFAQPQPVTAQHAYQHMVIEARLLTLGGDIAKNAIRALKNAGMKTEPAFAHFFRLEGDPYQTLLKLYPLDDQTLKAYISK